MAAMARFARIQERPARSGHATVIRERRRFESRPGSVCAPMLDGMRDGMVSVAEWKAGNFGASLSSDAKPNRRLQFVSAGFVDGFAGMSGPVGHFRFEELSFRARCFRRSRRFGLGDLCQAGALRRSRAEQDSPVTRHPRVVHARIV